MENVLSMFMTSVSEQLKLLHYLNVIPQPFRIVASMYLLMTKYLQATQCATPYNPNNQEKPQEDYSILHSELEGTLSDTVRFCFKQANGN